MRTLDHSLNEIEGPQGYPWSRPTPALREPLRGLGLAKWPGFTWRLFPAAYLIDEPRRCA